VTITFGLESSSRNSLKNVVKSVYTCHNSSSVLALLVIEIYNEYDESNVKVPNITTGDRMFMFGTFTFDSSYSL